MRFYGHYSYDLYMQNVETIHLFVQYNIQQLIFKLCMLVLSDSHGNSTNSSFSPFNQNYLYSERLFLRG